jgi:hypothetical protein
MFIHRITIHLLTAVFLFTVISLVITDLSILQYVWIEVFYVIFKKLHTFAMYKLKD